MAMLSRPNLSRVTGVMALLLQLLAAAMAASMVSSQALAAPLGIAPVNQLRQAAGMTPLRENAELAQAADHHAAYLQRNYSKAITAQGYAHLERDSLPLFTGENPARRALASGYAHQLVDENISIGSQNVDDSVIDLMTAIYHRFTFLDFNISEAGAASNEIYYVYKMGRAPLRETCENPSPQALAMAPVQCDQQLMRGASYAKLCAAVPAQAIFTPPYHQRCANGNLLNRDFMDAMCTQPPEQSLWRGLGSYYTFCEPARKIKASWLEQQCQTGNSAAVYPHSGQYYSLCDQQVKVHAQWYKAYCAALPAQDLYTDSGAVAMPCLAGHKLRAEHLSELAKQAQLNNPKAVIWPPDGAVDVRPAFFNEDPHPTPDKAATGYPISVQFNPALVKKAVINQFVLAREVRDSLGQQSWQEITDIRHLNSATDPNDLFTPLQFAWFPERRLAWNEQYRYLIRAQLDGQPHEWTGQFSIARLDAPVYELQLDTQQISISDDHFYLYQAPTQLEPEPFKSIGFSNRKFVNMSVAIVDPSTIEVRLSRTACLPVKFRFESARELAINPCF